MADEKKESSVAASVAKDIFVNMIKPRFLETTTNTITDLLYLLADSAVDFVSQKILGRPSSRKPTSQRTNYAKTSTAASMSSSPIITSSVTSRPSNQLEYIYIDKNAEITAVDDNGRPLTPRQFADKIVSDLTKMIARYGEVRVADLYERVGRTPLSTDFRYGWVNPDDIHYVPNRDGYWFNMPNPVLLPSVINK